MRKDLPWQEIHKQPMAKECMSSQEKMVGQSRRKGIPKLQKSTALSPLPKEAQARFRRAGMSSSTNEMDPYKNGNGLSEQRRRISYQRLYQLPLRRRVYSTLETSTISCFQPRVYFPRTGSSFTQGRMTTVNSGFTNRKTLAAIVHKT